MSNAIAIVRNLTDAGIDKQAAKAIAEAVVMHFDEYYATKTDIADVRAEIAELRGELKALATQIKFLSVLVAGLYVGMAILFVPILTG